MKSIVKLTCMLICSISFAQTNFLDISSWTVGSGSASGFPMYGLEEENIREMGIGPHGSSVLLWKAVPDSISSDPAGGWHSDHIAIDPAKTYRLTVWIKNTGSLDGRTYFAVDYASDDARTVDLSNGNDRSFFAGDMPELNSWWLLVCYVHNSSYTGINLGSLYSVNGTKVDDIGDLKFLSNAFYLSHQVELFDTTNALDNQYFYDPTIYEVNGQEPTIQQLLANPSSNIVGDTQAPTSPILSSIFQTDTAIDLSWTAATDNIGVTGYKIYKDSILEITLGNVLTYQVTGLTANTQYNFTVTALDASENESVVSNTISITTNASSGGGSGYWTLNNQNVYYTNGNVGIGTAIPDSKLTVKGSIHSEEVKVDLSVPAPDYVFETNYNLTPLEELQQYIKTYKHLPNIPSAKDMETNGVELGIMSMKLLEKIEELTLYILEQERRLRKLEGVQNKK